MTAFFRAHALAFTLLGLSFFFGSAGLVGAHVLRIRTMRDIGFPIAADVQPLQQRKAFLQEQAEIASLHASARGGAYRELYDLYVLPETPDMPRTLAVLERLLTHLQRQNIVRTIESVVADDATADITITLTTELGKGDALLNLFELSGVLTVNDAFTDAERAALIALTERENPTAIAALEQFLSGDLLQYARVPQLPESHVLQSIGSELFEQDFRALVDTSRLRSFAQVALLLDEDDVSLWPLPLFTIERAHWEESGDRDHWTITVRAQSKNENGEAKD